MSELTVFQAKFIGLARIEQSITGKWPVVCVMGDDDYARLQFLASDECTIPCDNIMRMSKSEIEYRNISCFRSGSFKGMVFGVPEMT